MRWEAKGLGVRRHLVSGGAVAVNSWGKKASDTLCQLQQLYCVPASRRMCVCVCVHATGAKEETLAPADCFTGQEA